MTFNNRYDYISIKKLILIFFRLVLRVRVNITISINIKIAYASTASTVIIASISSIVTISPTFIVLLILTRSFPQLRVITNIILFFLIVSIVLINLSIHTKVIRIYARLNLIFSNIFKDNENKNTILSIIKKVAYNNSEYIRILSRTSRFDNNINKSYYNITQRELRRAIISARVIVLTILLSIRVILRV